RNRRWCNMVEPMAPHVERALEGWVIVQEALDAERRNAPHVASTRGFANLAEGLSARCALELENVNDATSLSVFLDEVANELEMSGIPAGMRRNPAAAELTDFVRRLSARLRLTMSKPIHDVLAWASEVTRAYYE